MPLYPGWIRAKHSRLVRVVVLEEPVIGGLQAKLLLGTIKTAKDQKGTSAVLHHLEPFLDIWRKQKVQCESAGASLQILPGRVAYLFSR